MRPTASEWLVTANHSTQTHAHLSQSPGQQTERPRCVPSTPPLRHALPGGAACRRRPCAGVAGATAGCCGETYRVQRIVAGASGGRLAHMTQHYSAKCRQQQALNTPPPHPRYTPDQHRQVALCGHRLRREQHQHLGIQHRLKGSRHCVVGAPRSTACTDAGAVSGTVSSNGRQLGQRMGRSTRTPRTAYAGRATCRQRQGGQKHACMSAWHMGTHIRPRALACR